jgi:hypothetical protein
MVEEPQETNTFRDLAVKIGATKTTQDLEALKEPAKRARDEGFITEDQKRELGTLYATRWQELSAKPRKKAKQ